MLGRRRHLLRRQRRVRRVGNQLLAVSMSACSPLDIEDTPLDSLDPHRPFARRIDDLFWPVFWIAVGIFVLVQAAILGGSGRLF